MRLLKLALIILVSTTAIVLVGMKSLTEPTTPTQAVQQVQIAQKAPVKEAINADTIYTLVNSERNKAGAPLLARNPLLDTAAQLKCSDMASGNYYAHSNPTTGKHGYQFAQEAVTNDKTASENLNQGNFYTNKEYITSWLGSPSHKAAMLDPQYVDTGVAVCRVNSLDTIVQFFVTYYPQQQSTRLNTLCYRVADAISCH